MNGSVHSYIGITTTETPYFLHRGIVYFENGLSKISKTSSCFMNFSKINKSGSNSTVRELDADQSTWNIDVNLIEKAITPKTKAIMIVHIYGLPSNIDPILALAKKYNLKIIEDAAQAHGQEYNGKKCGGFGDVSTFSFYPNKHITTGEGGMIMASNEVLAKKCRSLRNLCFGEHRFIHDELGWNYRMSNLQAAVGVA